MTEQAKSLLDPQIQQCPFPFYKELRAEKPISFMPELGVFYIANYELGRKVLIDSRNFAKKTAENDGRRYIEPSKAAQKVLIDNEGGTPLSMMAQREGVEHRKYRNIVDGFFRSGAVQKMETHITAIATGLLDKIADRQECEVNAAFAVPLPVYVISDVLGIPKSEYLTFKKWSDAVLTYTALVVPDEQAVAGAEAMVEMHRYMLSAIDERRINPRDDLLTVLAQATYDGRPLTAAELRGFTDEILVAGNETTTSVIGAGLLRLAQDQALQARLRRQPDLIPGFVEEILRTSTPLQVALRFALNDMEIGGLAIPAGSKIYVGIGSANLDEKQFPAGENIDLDRAEKGSHVTFGAGVHHCLGAELARLELRIAFRLWLERFSSFELAQAAGAIEYPASYAVRGPLAVTLKYEVAA